MDANSRKKDIRCIFSSVKRTYTVGDSISKKTRRFLLFLRYAAPHITICIFVMLIFCGEISTYENGDQRRNERFVGGIQKLMSMQIPNFT